MNELHELLIQKIPDNILAHILFLDRWSEPPNFKTMSKPARLQLMLKYLPMAVEPTPSNYWIWFGAYAHKDQQPILNNTRVSRAMYECFHGPLKNPNGSDKRLVNALVETLADVNIYKFIPSFGNRFKSMSNHIQSNGMQVNYGQLLSAQQKKTNDFNIKTAFDTLIEYEDSFVTPEERKIALTALGHAPHIINSAEEQFNEYQLARSSSKLTQGDSNPSTPSQPEASEVGTNSAVLLDGQDDTNSG